MPLRTLARQIIFISVAQLLPCRLDMSKKHLSRNTVTAIGVERIGRLIELSEEAVRDGKEDRARRYVTLARRIGMKTRTKLPVDFRYCRKCLLPMMPGINCTVRLTGCKVVSSCNDCGSVKRTPYKGKRTR